MLQTGTVRWELGQGRVWNSKGYVVLPLTHYLMLLSPLWLLEGLEHPQTRSSPQNSILGEATLAAPASWPQQGCPFAPSLHLI